VKIEEEIQRKKEQFNTKALDKYLCQMN